MAPLKPRLDYNEKQIQKIREVELELEDVANKHSLRLQSMFAAEEAVERIKRTEEAHSEN
jgi:hypothetical protein